MRLGVAIALSAFALVAAAVGVLFFDLAERLRKEDDEFLADNLAVISELLHEEPVDEDAVLREVVWEWAARRHQRVYVRLFREGVVPRETAGMSYILPPAAFPKPHADGDAQEPALADYEVEPGHPHRLAAVRVAGSNTRPAATLQIALDRSKDRQLLADHRTRLLMVLGGGLVACGLVGYAVARRGLRRVRRMASTLAAVRPTNMGTRLDPAELPLELAQLATTLNGMLDRLEESFARLSRFSGDLAHELRTPVQNVRGEIEVALGRERTPAEYREALASTLEECVRLSELIDRLLFLARADDPRMQIRREPMDLARELESVREFYEAAASEKGVALRVDAPPGVEVSADRMLLQRAVGNLISNALAHTPSGGSVTLAGSRADGRIEIRVTDTGVGIPEDAQSHVFERFFRVDSARDGSTPGAGLGLAIVRSITHLHGGSVALASVEGRGTTVTMSLPAGG